MHKCKQYLISILFTEQPHRISPYPFKHSYYSLSLFIIIIPSSCRPLIIFLLCRRLMFVFIHIFILVLTLFIILVIFHVDLLGLFFIQALFVIVHTIKHSCYSYRYLKYYSYFVVDWILLVWAIIGQRTKRVGIRRLTKPC